MPFECPFCGRRESRWVQGTTDLRCGACGHTHDAVDALAARKEVG